MLDCSCLSFCNMNQPKKLNSKSGLLKISRAEWENTVTASHPAGGCVCSPQGCTIQTFVSFLQKLKRFLNGICEFCMKDLSPSLFKFMDNNLIPQFQIYEFPFLQAEGCFPAQGRPAPNYDTIRSSVIPCFSMLSLVSQLLLKPSFTSTMRVKKTWMQFSCKLVNKASYSFICLWISSIRGAGSCSINALIKSLNGHFPSMKLFCNPIKEL